MLRDGEPNPLTVHGLREMGHCPPHFVPVYVDLRTTEKNLRDWIWENLEGRFFLGDHFFQNENGAITMTTCAAFEIPGEASMFTLCLDQIQQTQYLS